MRPKKRTYKFRSRHKRKSIFFRFFSLLALFLLLACGFAYLFQYGISNLKVFNIKEIEIKGTQFINDDILCIRLSSFQGENLFEVAYSEIEKVLSKSPKIKSFKVIRKIPYTLKISIIERIPIAYLKSLDGDVYLIDIEGVLLSFAKDLLEYDLPVFSNVRTDNLTLGNVIQDEAINVLLDVYRKIKEFNSNFFCKLAEFYIKDGEVVIVEKGRGVRFLLGEENFSERIDKLIFTYQNFGIANFLEIDVRFNDIVILR
ncbi:MAG: FtsQ-type POTRA domain-containing protein [Candidatus Cloacimonetes bacterium]|nr:FtsQ-type POTRA domain-containing protein [Candidatus Cloacimonadota bacterium]MBL7086287.1 FtsQ-type POTRA domain-containing protein [Candidatus Cloacimonadota bacterium]